MNEIGAGAAGRLGIIALADWMVLGDLQAGVQGYSWMMRTLLMRPRVGARSTS